MSQISRCKFASLKIGIQTLTSAVRPGMMQKLSSVKLVVHEPHNVSGEVFEEAINTYRCDPVFGHWQASCNHILSGCIISTGSEGACPCLLGLLEKPALIHPFYLVGEPASPCSSVLA